MEWVEIAAKTIEQARERALDTLGVDEQDAEIEILEHPRPGLFGMLRGQARVRARVRPAQVRPKVERRERRRRRGEGAAGGARSKPDDDLIRTNKAEARNERGERTTATDSVDGGTAVAVEPAGAEDGTAAAVGGGSSRKRSRRGGRRSGTGRSAGGAHGDHEEGDDEKGGPTMPELTIDEQASVAAEFLAGLAERFGVQAAEASTTRVDDDTMEIRLDGDELGLLIGPKGQTLYLIQELARTAVQRRGGGVHEGRIRIDIAGYRQRRSEALARFTQQVAADVLSSGQAKSLEPMNPADRKVVHDTANSIEGVRTVSEGEEPRRRVVLLPAE